jgi:hypothetical protein
LNAKYAVAVADIQSFMSILRFRIEGSSDINADESVLHKLREEIVKQVCALTKTRTEVHYGGMSGDSIILGSKDIDALFSFCVGLRQVQVKMLGNKGLPGPIRVGIALYDKTLGVEFRGVFPGVTAMKIGDKSRRPIEAISVTKPVFAELSEPNKRQFVLSNEPGCGQGNVYLNTVPDSEAKG